MKKVYLLSLVFTLFLSQPLYASNLKLDFSQNNQTYNWNNRLEYFYNKDPKLSWELLFSLNSLLIKKAIQDRWQEDGNLKLKFDYLVKKYFKAGILLNHKLSSLGEREVTSQDYLVTSELNFWQRFKLSQNLGISSLSRKSDKARG
ncbi:MAG: hypothetical protein MUO78_02870, partial [candidate division Zixibacteria bacterium]|nr:hypothetical protein [candidate division Zixibacteria bacterium]